MRKIIGCKICISPLPESMKPSEIISVISSHASIESIKIISDEITGVKKSFCLVELSEGSDHKKVIEVVSNTLFEGSLSYIKPCRD